MTNTLQILVTIAAVALATFATRVLPFMCFGSREPPLMLLTIEKNLPPIILLLLVIYCLKDVQWIASPYGIPELFSIGIVAGLHFWKKKRHVQYLYWNVALYGTCSVQFIFVPVI